MADPTISHGWTTSEPDAGKDVDEHNLNDHQISGFGAAVSGVVDPAITTHAGASDPHGDRAAAASDATTKANAAQAAAIAASDAAGTAATAVAAEATLARNADNLTSGTVADARIAATIARDSEVTSAVAAEAAARDSAITSAVSALSSVYQPLDSDLSAIAALATTAFGRGVLALADAAALRTAAGLGTLATQSGTFSGTSSGTNTGDQTLPTRASLGLDTTDSPQFAGLNVGAATDTTITRTGAGDIAVEGNGVYRAGGTDVLVADGGTGASSASAARTNLGLVIGTDVSAPSRISNQVDGWKRATVGETHPRWLTGTSDFAVTSGTLHLIAGPYLFAGDVINSFEVGVSGTGSGTLTHSWFCLVKPSDRSVVCKTADDTSAWGSFAMRSVAMGTPFTILTSGVYYIGLVIVATTIPTLRGINVWSQLSDQTPRLIAKSTTGLTTPASLGATAAALTDSGAGSVMPWIGIS